MHHDKGEAPPGEDATPHDGEATEERAGRPKKYFEITALGKRAMEHMKSTRDELWKAIPKVAWNVKMLEPLR